MSSRTSNSKCTDFQTQDGIELESCLLSLSDKDKSFSGSLVLDLRIWSHGGFLKQKVTTHSLKYEMYCARR